VASFRDVLPSYFDDEEDEDLGYAPPRPPAFRDSGNPEDMRRAVQQTAPETQGIAERLIRGGLHDIQELGQALASPVYYGAREVYRTARDPAGQAEKYAAFASKLAEDPYGAAMKAGSALGEALVEPYRAREGEGFLDVAKRNVLDRPLGTLMDASALVGIPAGLAGKAGVAGARVVAEKAALLDPLTLAQKAITKGLKTTAPDALARLEASRMITDLAAEQKTRAIAVNEEFKTRAAGVFADLDPAEKALFFPYVEGRLKMMTPEGGAAGLHELTPEGAWAPRGMDPARIGRLEEAKQRYLPILDEMEIQMGYKPEQAAQRASDAVMKGADPFDPDAQMRASDAAEQAFMEAEERALMRRTLSTRTSLDVMREKQFTAKVEEGKLAGNADAVKEAAATYPRKPATPQDALDLWGTDQQGVYFPHSGEIFTKDQVNIGNLLTKVRESVPWKKNQGTLYRTGALETMDPEKALLRTAVGLRGGAGRAEILDALGQKFGQKLEGNYQFGSDPDFRAGTHELLRPGLLHQEAALGEDLNDLMKILLRNGDDPAVAGMNLAELTARAAGGLDTRYPMRTDAPAYKIPTGVGHAIKEFTASLEPSTNPMAKFLDTAADPFHFVTLNLRPARILNNLVGNTTFQVLQGIHPFSTTGIGAISDMVKAVAYKAGLTKSEQAGKLAKVFDLPGVSTGGVTGTEEYASRTATFLKESPIAKVLGGKQLAAYGETMGRLNEHVENTARALSTLFELRKSSPGLLGRMASSAKVTMDLGDRIAELAGQGAKALDDADYAGALKNVNRFLNDYGRTSALERNVLRRIFPYQKFYRHAVELALRTPFEQPAKMAVLRTIGKAAKQDFEETLSGWGFDPQSMVLPWQQASVPLWVEDNNDGRGPHVRLLNLQGPNPFSLFAASGDPGQEALGALHPVVKAGLESAFGINLFTLKPFQGPTSTFGNQEIDPHTGLVDQARVRPGPLAQFTKQFFPAQLARDLLAGGRQPLDASSLLDQFLADASDTPGSAYKVDERGEALRRPTANPFARLFVPVPQTLEAPTREQAAKQKGTITESYRKLGRSRPDLQPVLRDRRRAAAATRRQKERDEGRPYRVRPRPE
jgi:hypothetical protein